MGRLTVACSHAGEKQHASCSDFGLFSSPEISGTDRTARSLRRLNSNE